MPNKEPPKKKPSGCLPLLVTVVALAVFGLATRHWDTRQLAHQPTPRADLATAYPEPKPPPPQIPSPERIQEVRERLATIRKLIAAKRLPEASAKHEVLTGELAPLLAKPELWTEEVIAIREKLAEAEKVLGPWMAEQRQAATRDMNRQWDAKYAEGSPADSGGLGKLSDWRRKSQSARLETSLRIAQSFLHITDVEIARRPAVEMETCISGVVSQAEAEGLFDALFKNKEIPEIAALCAVALGWGR